MKLRAIIYLTGAILFGNAAFYAPVAMAGHDHDDKHEKHAHKKHKHDHDYDDEKEYKEYRESNQVVILNYLDVKRSRHCPPGLARKHACISDHARRYRVGEVIHEREYQPLPQEVLVQLRPVEGYRYVLVNDDVALISETTQNIVDVISRFSR
jgi:ABC-type Zn2+ transport system substrate-binding protein/surface adhesin